MTSTNFGGGLLLARNTPGSPPRESTSSAMLSPVAAATTESAHLLDEQLIHRLRTHSRSIDQGSLELPASMCSSLMSTSSYPGEISITSDGDTEPLKQQQHPAAEAEAEGSSGDLTKPVDQIVSPPASEDATGSLEDADQQPQTRSLEDADSPSESQSLEDAHSPPNARSPEDADAAPATRSLEDAVRAAASDPTEQQHDHHHQQHLAVAIDVQCEKASDPSQQNQGDAVKHPAEHQQEKSTLPQQQQQQPKQQQQKEEEQQYKAQQQQQQQQQQQDKKAQADRASAVPAVDIPKRPTSSKPASQKSRSSAPKLKAISPRRKLPSRIKTSPFEALTTTPRRQITLATFGVDSPRNGVDKTGGAKVGSSPNSPRSEAQREPPVPTKMPVLPVIGTGGEVLPPNSLRRTRSGGSGMAIGVSFKKIGDVGHAPLGTSKKPAPVEVSADSRISLSEATRDLRFSEERPGPPVPRSAPPSPELAPEAPKPIDNGGAYRSLTSASVMIRPSARPAKPRPKTLTRSRTRHMPRPPTLPKPLSPTITDKAALLEKYILIGRTSPAISNSQDSCDSSQSSASAPLPIRGEAAAASMSPPPAVMPKKTQILSKDRVQASSNEKYVREKPSSPKKAPASPVLKADHKAKAPSPRNHSNAPMVLSPKSSSSRDREVSKLSENIPDVEAYESSESRSSERPPPATAEADRSHERPPATADDADIGDSPHRAVPRLSELPPVPPIPAGGCLESAALSGNLQRMDEVIQRLSRAQEVESSRSVSGVSPWPKFSKLPLRSGRDAELEDTTKRPAKANVNYAAAAASKEDEDGSGSGGTDLDQSTLRVNYVDDGMKGFRGEFALTDDEASYSEDDAESVDDVPMPILHHHQPPPVALPSAEAAAAEAAGGMPAAIGRQASLSTPAFTLSHRVRAGMMHRHQLARRLELSGEEMKLELGCDASPRGSPAVSPRGSPAVSPRGSPTTSPRVPKPTRLKTLTELHGDDAPQVRITYTREPGHMAEHILPAHKLSERFLRHRFKLASNAHIACLVDLRTHKKFYSDPSGHFQRSGVEPSRSYELLIDVEQPPDLMSQVVGGQGAYSPSGLDAASTTRALISGRMKAVDVGFDMSQERFPIHFDENDVAVACALSRNIYLDDVKLISIALQKENKRNRLGLSRFQVARSGRIPFLVAHGPSSVWVTFGGTPVLRELIKAFQRDPHKAASRMKQRGLAAVLLSLTTQRFLRDSETTGSKVFFVGHSIGGAIAHLTCADFLIARLKAGLEPNAVAISFGCPLMGGVKHIGKLKRRNLHGHFCTVINQFDCMPRLLNLVYQCIVETFAGAESSKKSDPKKVGAIVDVLERTATLFATTGDSPVPSDNSAFQPIMDAVAHMEKMFAECKLITKFRCFGLHFLISFYKEQWVTQTTSNRDHVFKHFNECERIDGTTVGQHSIEDYARALCDYRVFPVIDIPPAVKEVASFNYYDPVIASVRIEPYTVAPRGRDATPESSTVSEHEFPSMSQTTLRRRNLSIASIISTPPLVSAGSTSSLHHVAVASTTSPPALNVKHADSGGQRMLRVRLTGRNLEFLVGKQPLSCEVADVAVWDRAVINSEETKPNEGVFTFVVLANPKLTSFELEQQLKGAKLSLKTAFSVGSHVIFDMQTSLERMSTLLETCQQAFDILSEAVKTEHGWRLQRSSKSEEHHCYGHPFSTKRLFGRKFSSAELMCMRSRATVESTPEEVLEVLKDIGHRRRYDNTFAQADTVEVINENTSVLCLQFKRRGLFVSQRDLCVVRQWRTIGPAHHAVCWRSVEHEGCPPNEKFIRANCIFGGYYIHPSATDESLTEFESFVWTDQGGMLRSSQSNSLNVTESLLVGDMVEVIRRTNHKFKANVPGR